MEEIIPKKSNISVESLIQKGAHFGHQKKYWNPKMKKYVHCVKNNIVIIDLQKTMLSLNDACNFIFKKIKNKNNKILFVSTKNNINLLIKETAENVNMPYVINRWLGGTLTNNITIRKNINKMNAIDDIIKNANEINITKKELSILNKKSIKLHANFDGIKDMKKLPDALFVIDPKRENIAVNEAIKLNIPIVGIIDTDGDPSKINYPIPCNDDSIKSISEILKVIENVISTSIEIINKKINKEKTIANKKRIIVKKSITKPKIIKDKTVKKETKTTKTKKNSTKEETVKNKIIKKVSRKTETKIKDK